MIYESKVLDLIHHYERGEGAVGGSGAPGCSALQSGRDEIARQNLKRSDKMLWKVATCGVAEAYLACIRSLT